MDLDNETDWAQRIHFLQAKLGHDRRGKLIPMTDKKVVIVVCTIGRPEALERLLESLSSALLAGDQIVVVAQGEFERVSEVCLRSRVRGLPIHYIRSARGLSLGRNLAVGTLPTRSDYILMFPNDTCRLSPEVIARVREAATKGQLGAVTVRDENGAKFDLPAPGTELNPINVWKVIEPGLFITSTLFRKLGGFDENLGTGAETPWQSGEGTDLLLRAIRLQHGAQFQWIPASDAHIEGVPDSLGLSTAERRRKLRAYGRGYGYILKKWNFPISKIIRAVVGAPLFGLRHPGYGPLDGFWVQLGRIEGLIGTTVGQGKQVTALTSSGSSAHSGSN